MVSLPARAGRASARPGSAAPAYRGIFGVAARGADPESELDALMAAEERVFARAESCLPVRRGTTGELQWLLRRAACRGVCRAGAGRSLGAERVDRRDRRRRGGRSSRCGPRRCGTSTRRCSSRTAAWSSTPRRGARIRRCSAGRAARAVGVPGQRRAAVLAMEALAFPIDAWCTRAGSPTATRSRRVRRRIVDADNAYAEQRLDARAAVVSWSRRTGSSRASSTPTCRATSTRRC